MTIRLGISACLLGRPVRYDGGHNLDRFLVDELGRSVEYVPVCPEAEAGLGVPRETMRLVGDPEHPRLVTVHTGTDLTDLMAAWAARRVQELEAENLSGFIFKKDSPSCGLMQLKVYAEDGVPIKKGVGMFARAFVEHFPTLPVEEEGRLDDAGIRENFMERVFALKAPARTGGAHPKPRSLGALPQRTQTAPDGPRPRALPHDRPTGRGG